MKVQKYFRLHKDTYPQVALRTLCVHVSVGLGRDIERNILRQPIVCVVLFYLNAVEP